MKTAELTGAALDWAVAKCEGDIWAAPDGELLGSAVGLNYSTDWAQGGPIVEREGIDMSRAGRLWWARLGDTQTFTGDTALIAAMRCYVASKLGDTVDIPKELHP